MGRVGLYDESIHIVPLLAPVDAAAVAKTTDEVNSKHYDAMQFVLQFGVITGDTVVVTVEECTNTSGDNNTAIAFRSRLTAAVSGGADSPAAWAASTSAGKTVAAADDGKALIVEIDPAALSDTKPYVRVVATPGGSMSVCLINIFAVLKPKYPQATNINALS